jgi:NAD(P)-dependent dehydrogenase (short-subunit alcohol dehydrogenase family)
MNVKGKVAIVTGAGGAGSGRAIAKRLAEDGASVVVADINEDGGRETVRLINAAHGRAAFIRTDLGQEAEIRALVASTEREFGGLNILINNASPELSPDDWFGNVQVDLLGAMYAIRASMEVMRRRNGGAIVNIGSVSALCHGGRVSRSPGYDVAKAGVMRLTTTLSGLADRDGIRVNCLVPGWIASPPVKAYWDSLSPEERRIRNVPATLLSVDEIAAAVVKLITDDGAIGRILVWWNDQPARFVPVGDPGYATLE